MQTRISAHPDEVADTSSSSPLLSLEKSPPEKEPSLPTLTGLDHPQTSAKRPSDTANSERPTKKARTGEEWPEFHPPHDGRTYLKKDLEAYGFPAQRIKVMISKKEVGWDPAAPGHLRATVKAQASLRQKPRRTVKRVSNGEGKDKYEPLILRRGSPNWALYDPIEHPHLLSNGVPPTFEGLASFQPGNTRIVEFNIETKSLRLRSTPASLQGKVVKYLPAGPKIMESETKTSRGRLRKPSLPVNGAADSEKNKARTADSPPAIAQDQNAHGEIEETVLKIEIRNGGELVQFETAEEQSERI